MKILFINPPFQRLKGISSRYFPMGLGYLVSTAKSLGNEAMLYNAEIPAKDEKVNYENVDNLLELHHNYINALNNDNHYVWKEIESVLKEYKPDIVGLSVMTPKYASAAKISKIAKSVLPNSKVIWGGPHATILPEDAMKVPQVDFLVRGEGEKVLENLIEAIKGKISYENIKGISFRNKSLIKHNTDESLIENLDSIARIDRESNVFNERYEPSDMNGIIGSRGCPFRCGFCGAKNIWTRKVRYCSIDKIIEEIQVLKNKYKLEYFSFWDDSFTANKKRTIELCEKIVKNKLNIKWSCTTRVDILDDEILKAMKKAGCSNIDIGIESGSDRMLIEIKKDITKEKVRKAQKLIRKNGINVNSYFMIGFPTETLADMEETAAFMQEKQMGKILFSIFTPYPGADLYLQADQLGLIPKNIDWSNFSHQSPENHFVKNVEKADFEKQVHRFNNLVKKHNSNWRVLWMVHKNRISLYLKNPVSFIKKAINSI